MRPGLGAYEGLEHGLTGWPELLARIAGLKRPPETPACVQFCNAARLIRPGGQS